MPKYCVTKYLNAQVEKDPGISSRIHEELDALRILRERDQLRNQFESGVKPLSIEQLVNLKLISQPQDTLTTYEKFVGRKISR